ncbi:pantoate--beta-alanine ligase [Terracidiphilus gabretensis]|uniref:pantoate--beta-alanine ligase n=1 Tax=Terracidiphilus gabretensis TaxID=1577687 RepID=UPI00071C0E32|nr:pantoate--beta-alanine ligase [Terracidiphilus gabretensis]
MQIIHTVSELRHWSRQQRAAGKIIGLVPTLGALHAGHASLIRAAHKACDAVAVSIFVNPTQFGPNEDFSRYPRTFDADCKLAEAEGADVIFAPSVEEIYPNNATTFVEVAELSDRLDGASRPGHFRGVATVVSKLFIAAEPDRTYFGQKDAAQVAVLRRMTADLRLGVEIVVCPIIRDPDGLALSSRNIYLSAEERKQALSLSRAIRRVETLFTNGVSDTTVLIAAAEKLLQNEEKIRIDYIALVDWSTLLPVEIATPGTLLAIAAHVGATRLIDNTILH